MRINGYRNTYAHDGAPDQVPPALAPATQPQVRGYSQAQRVVPYTQQEPPARNVNVSPYGTGDARHMCSNNGDDADGRSTGSALRPLRPQVPGAANRPWNSIDDESGNHVRDRWDESGTHVRDSWNDRNGARTHEKWDRDGVHVRDAWNERTGRHQRDVWASDGTHVRDTWDELGNYLPEAWNAQSQYLRKAWNELTARLQDMFKLEHGGEAGPSGNRGRHVWSAPSSPVEGPARPGTERGDAYFHQPGAGNRRAGPPNVTTPASRPVGDNRYGRGAGPIAPGSGDGGGCGGSAGPTGGAGNAGPMRNAGPSGDAPDPAPTTNGDASQFSQAQLVRLNGATQNLIHIIDRALERLDKYGANDPELKKWFGENADPEQIRQTLTKMRDTLASGNYKLVLDPPTRDNWEMAHVSPDDASHTIHIRPHMLDPVFGKYTPEITLAHELSHFNDIGGTRDLTYGDGNASALAQTNSANAMHNAENYGMFIRQVTQA